MTSMIIDAAPFPAGAGPRTAGDAVGIPNHRRVAEDLEGRDASIIRPTARFVNHQSLAINYHLYMRRLPLRDIRLTDRFWSGWQKTLREVTIEAEYQKLVETKRLQNFINAAATTGIGEQAMAALCDATAEISHGQPPPSETNHSEGGGFIGYYFNDSDVYKWCEAAAYALSSGADAKIQSRLDEVIGLIVAAQQPDGYLNTFFQIKHPHLKWRNLNSMHEMYCGGHLIEAGVALFETTGDRRLLDVGVRFANHVMSVFGPDKRPGYCGHQEIELALLRLSK